MKVYLLTTEENRWSDELFERVKDIEEFCEKVKQDYAIWQGARQNPKEVAKTNAVHLKE